MKENHTREIDMNEIDDMPGSIGKSIPPSHHEH